MLRMFRHDVGPPSRKDIHQIDLYARGVLDRTQGENLARGLFETRGTLRGIHVNQAGSWELVTKAIGKRDVNPTSMWTPSSVLRVGGYRKRRPFAENRR